MWGWWSAAGITSAEDVDEFWGEAGRFFGIYPKGDLAACAAVLPNETGKPGTVEDRRDLLRHHFSGFGGRTVREALDRL